MVNDPPGGPTIANAIAAYLDMLRLARSDDTARTYANGLRALASVLSERWLPPDKTPAANLPEAAVGWLAKHLKHFSPATERVYLDAAIGFYTYAAAENLANVNLPRVRQLIKQRARRPGIRLPQFPTEEIEKLLQVILLQEPGASDSGSARLRAMRDRAFLLTLADTGLRVSEACRLRRGDLDLTEGRAIVIGKGDKEAIVRFSSRATRAITAYLALRAMLDGQSGRPLTSLPLFARHDKGAGSKIKPITTNTGRNIVRERVAEFLGEATEGQITPHSFRHYFVTSVLRGSGNLKLAQALARHKSIQVTQRYAHLSDEELDRGYHEIFENDDRRRNIGGG